MPVNITYPEMIAAFKLWYGQNKTRPSPTVQIDGQDSVRKSSFGEMIVAGLTALATFAATAGFEFVTGGAEGLNKFLDSVPKEIAEPAKALVASAGKVYDDFKAGIDAFLPPGSDIADFKDAIGSVGTSISENFINPLGEVFTGFRAALSGDASTLNGLVPLYTLQDNTLAAALASGASSLGTGISDIIDSAKAWTDEITLGNSFTLKDAFQTVNDAPTNFMATYLGIGEGPALSDLVGTLVKTDLIDSYTGAKDKEKAAALELRQAAAIKFPTVTIDVEGVPTSITNPDIAALASLGIETASLSLAEKAAILLEYDERINTYTSALEDLGLTSDAIKDQVRADQQNILLSQKAQTSVDNIGAVASEYNSITDPEQRAIYERTLKPTVLATTKQIAPLMDAALSGNSPFPTVPSDVT
jgi:hypothetical protein